MRRKVIIIILCIVISTLLLMQDRDDHDHIKATKKITHMTHDEKMNNMNDMGLRIDQIQNQKDFLDWTVLVTVSMGFHDMSDNC